MWLLLISKAGGLARMVPPLAWAVLLALAWGGVQHHRATVAGAQALQAQQQLEQIRADAAQATVTALAHQVATEQEAIHGAQQAAARDRAGADAAAAALRRLRDRSANAGGACAAPAAAPGGEAAGGGPTVPAELLERLGEAAGRLAAIADERGRAGAACERIAVER